MMLTLSNIASRISELETEELSSVNTQFDTWLAMLRWRYWLHSLNGDDYHKHFDALPAGHSVRTARGKLVWFTIHFVNVLPNNVTWQSEKAEIAFACWLEEAIAENFSESALSTETAMQDCLAFVSTCLTNGSMDFFDVKKKQEQENWAKKLEFRRLANFGELTPEAEEWLRENDSAFLENFISKKEVKPEVKPLVTEAITQALPEIKPEAPKPVNEFVTAHWSGVDQGWLAHTVDGDMPIYRNRLYKFSADVWQNIESDNYLKVRWHKASNE